MSHEDLIDRLDSELVNAEPFKEDYFKTLRQSYSDLRAACLAVEVPLCWLCDRRLTKPGPCTRCGPKPVGGGGS